MTLESHFWSSSVSTFVSPSFVPALNSTKSTDTPFTSANSNSFPSLPKIADFLALGSTDSSWLLLVTFSVFLKQDQVLVGRPKVPTYPQFFLKQVFHDGTAFSRRQVLFVAYDEQRGHVWGDFGIGEDIIEELGRVSYVMLQSNGIDDIKNYSCRWFVLVEEFVT